MYILTGHRIPSRAIALAVFKEKPTKEQLFNLNIFSLEREMDRKLIDVLLKHDAAALHSNSFVYEYNIKELPDNGSLDLCDMLYTGWSDMLPKNSELIIYI